MHGNERLSFSTSTWIPNDPWTLKRVKEAAKQVKDDEKSDSENAKKRKMKQEDPDGFYQSYAEHLEVAIKDYLYTWKLDTNQWHENLAHDDFMERNGIILTLEFMQKQLNINPEHHKTIVNPADRIRAKMEKFGSELEEYFHDELEHQSKVQNNLVNSNFKFENQFKHVENVDVQALPSDHWSTMPFDDSKKFASSSASYISILQRHFQADESVIIPLAGDKIWTDLCTTNTHDDSDHDGATLLHNAIKLADRMPGSSFCSHIASHITSADEDEAQERADELEENDSKKKVLSWATLLYDYSAATCSAMLRCLHLLTRFGTHTSITKAREIVVLPSTLRMIRRILRSCNYGMPTVESFARDNEDIVCGEKCGASIKLLYFILSSICNHPTPVGAKQSLNALDSAEIMLMMLSEMMQRMSNAIYLRARSTLEARATGSIPALSNFDSFPINLARHVSTSEERLMSSLARTASILFSFLSSIHFFGGSTDWIARGNRLLQHKAFLELVTTNKTFQNSLFIFLLYDLQTSSFIPDAKEVKRSDPSPDDADKTKKKSRHEVGGEMPSFMKGSWIDDMRVHIIDSLGHLFLISPNYKKTFMSRFYGASIRANLTIRTSLVHALLQSEAYWYMREQLDYYTATNKIFAADEYILEHAFVQHTNSSGSTSFVDNEYKLLILTTRAWYTSDQSYTFPLYTSSLSASSDIYSNLSWITRGDILPSGLSSTLKLQVHDYHDVNSIFISMGSQSLSIRSFASPASERVKSAVINHTVDSFVFSELGVRDRIQRTFIFQSRDDLARPATQEIDHHVTHQLVTRMLAKHHNERNIQPTSEDENSKIKNFKYSIKLHTIVRVRDSASIASSSSSLVAKTLIWIDGHTEKHGTKQYLIIADFDHANWLKYFTSRHEHVDNVDVKALQESIYTPKLVYDFHDLQAMDFTENSSTNMLLNFEANGAKATTISITFFCDTAREIWRRQLRKLFVKAGGREHERVNEIAAAHTLLHVL